MAKYPKFGIKSCLVTWKSSSALNNGRIFYHYHSYIYIYQKDNELHTICSSINIKHLDSEIVNIQKTKMMASGLIISCQIDVETGIDFILGGSKITAGGDYSHEIELCLLLGRKVMTNLDSILKIRNVTLPAKAV